MGNILLSYILPESCFIPHDQKRRIKLSYDQPESIEEARKGIREMFVDGKRNVGLYTLRKYSNYFADSWKEVGFQEEIFEADNIFETLIIEIGREYGLVRAGGIDDCLPTKYYMVSDT